MTQIKVRQFEGDSVGFTDDEISGVKIADWTKEVVVFVRRQDLLRR